MSGYAAMTHCDAMGYLASGLVLGAFGMKDMVKLRIVAIGSNVVFLAYGLSLGLTPVWLLHLALLPLNVWRLAQALQLSQNATNVAVSYRPAESRQDQPQDLSTSQVTA